jgi:hypothetical protein
MRVNDRKFHSMRKLCLIFLILITVLTGCKSGTEKKQPDPAVINGISEIVFREYQHDFGKVAAGENISYVFTFENKGTSDLVIISATTSCGCTVPKYDTKPIPPGGDGNLEVVFDTSGREGFQTKTISVKSNALIPVVLLKITAFVETTNQ